MRINLDDPKTTLRLDPKRKRKAFELAQARNLSLNQFIEELIDAAEEPRRQPSIQKEVASLQRQLGELNTKMGQLEKKVTGGKKKQ